jgi:erythronate-4-phosphate dehydrogenase
LHLNPEFLDLGKQFTLGIIGLGNVNTFSLYGAIVGLECDWYDPLVQR